jgi:hypothetical protein
MNIRILTAIMIFTAVAPLRAQTLPGLDAPVSAAVGVEPTEPSSEQLSRFPSTIGHRSLYVSFYASRKHKKRQLIEETNWDEVTESAIVHGFRVVFVRSSTGTLKRDAAGGWLYGEPVSTTNESVYVVTSKGVALRTVYSIASGLAGDYALRRQEILESYADESREEFIGELQNWILPFPLNPGSRRAWNVDENSYYKVLRGGDKRFLHASFRKTAVGVAGFISGQWAMTRWFSPKDGLVLTETHNADPGVDHKKFPFKAKALAVYAAR